MIYLNIGVGSHFTCFILAICLELCPLLVIDDSRIRWICINWLLHGNGRLTKTNHERMQSWATLWLHYSQKWCSEFPSALGYENYAAKRDQWSLWLPQDVPTTLVLTALWWNVRYHFTCFNFVSCCLRLQKPDADQCKFVNNWKWHVNIWKVWKPVATKTCFQVKSYRKRRTLLS